MNDAAKQRAEFLEDATATALRAAGRLFVGEHTYGAPHVYWWGEDAHLHIGKFCSIALDVSLILGGNHRVDWITTYPFSEFEDWPQAHSLVGHPSTKGDIRIGNDVWLGNGATVLSGVTVGDGAVVGARALVAKDVPPYSIVAGNPAAVVRQRFAPDVVAGLLKLQWWDWPPRRIKKWLPTLLSGDVETFLAENLAARPSAAPQPRRPRLWRRST